MKTRIKKNWDLVSIRTCNQDLKVEKFRKLKTFKSLHSLNTVSFFVIAFVVVEVDAGTSPGDDNGMNGAETTIYYHMIAVQQINSYCNI